MTTPTKVGRFAEEVAEFGQLVAKHGRSGHEFTAYAGKPLAFIADVLKVTLTAQQQRIVDLYQRHRLVAVRSGVGLGKTTVIACLALHHAYAEQGTVVALSATDRQVRELLFGELRRIWLRVGDLPGELFAQALRIDESTGQRIVGFVSTDADRIRGWHHPQLLVLVDEGQALPAFVWEAATSLLTGERNKLVAVGNPGPPTGLWFDIHRGTHWATLALSGLDHPNVLENREVVPGAITRQFIADRAAEFGTNSAIYRSTVLGEFVADVGEGLVDRTWLERAARRWLDGERARAGASRFAAALDVARFGGDWNCLAVRFGSQVLPLVKWRGTDLMATADRSIREVTALGCRLTGYDPESFNIGREGGLTVDEVGVGAGVLDRLVQLGVTARGYNAGSSPKVLDRFANRRAESYFGLRRLLESDQLALAPDDELWQELEATRWLENARGLIAIEPKVDLVARLGRSPDAADAVSMVTDGLYRPASQMWRVGRLCAA